MSITFKLNRLAAATLLALAGTSQAAIVEGADVGGIRTFTDTATGLIWADLDNHLTFTGSAFAFRYADYTDYLNALTAAGFVWATTTEVNALVATVPLTTTSQYGALGIVMGSLSFGETTTLDGYTDYGEGDAYRVFGAPSWTAGTAQWMGAWSASLPTVLNDSGLWAYLAAPGGGGSVPLPGTLALAGLGLAALTARPTCRRRATT